MQSDAEIRTCLDQLSIPRTDRWVPVCPVFAIRTSTAIPRFLHAMLKDSSTPTEPAWTTTMSGRIARSDAARRPSPGRRMPMLCRPSLRYACPDSSDAVMRSQDVAAGGADKAMSRKRLPPHGRQILAAVPGTQHWINPGDLRPAACARLGRCVAPSLGQCGERA